MSNYGAWTAGAEGIGGFAQALLKKKQMDREMEMNAPQYSPKDFGVENAPRDFKLTRQDAVSLLKGQQGQGMYTLGDIVPGLRGTSQGMLPVSAKAAPSLAVSGMSATKPTAEQEKSGQETKSLMALGNQLAGRWKEGGFGTGSTDELVRGVAAQYLPGRLGQRVAGPDQAKYANTASLFAETALRVATGAAAPDPEKRQYEGYIPTPGDSPEVAAGKIDDFFTRLEARSEAAAKDWETRGMPAMAEQVRSARVNELSKLRQELMQSFGVAPQAPTQNAPAIGEPRIVGRRPKG